MGMSLLCHCLEAINSVVFYCQKGNSYYKDLKHKIHVYLLISFMKQQAPPDKNYSSLRYVHTTLPRLLHFLQNGVSLILFIWVYSVILSICLLYGTLSTILVSFRSCKFIQEYIYLFTLGVSLL